jgi:hypothetical protein
MSRAFLIARTRLKLLDSESQQAIASTISSLASSELPEKKDEPFMMPPALQGYLREVPWLEVSIAYDFDATFLYLLTLKSNSGLKK